MMMMVTLRLWFLARLCCWFCIDIRSAALFGVEHSMLGHYSVLVKVGTAIIVVIVVAVVIVGMGPSVIIACCLTAVVVVVRVVWGHAFFTSAISVGATILGAVHIVNRHILLIFDEVSWFTWMLVFVVVSRRVACVNLFIAVATSR